MSHSIKSTVTLFALAAIICGSFVTTSAQTFASLPVEARDAYMPEDHKSDVVLFRQASYKGGIDQLTEYLLDNFEYPEAARENGIDGKMVVSFKIDRDGSVIDVEMLQSAHPLLDAALIKCVESMDNWNAALRYGQEVQSTVVLPFKATLK